jgi:lipoprotein-releasing system ATP-binding protein
VRDTELETVGNGRFLQARGVCRSFETSEGLLKVLKGVNLDVSKGSMIAITGESGVGKSTLLHILGGLDRPTEGSVEIDNELLADKDESNLAAYRNRKIGFVFQHHYLLEDFTALENVMIPSLIMGNDKEKAASIAELLLNDVGLKDRKKHRPNQLSGGEQQRVAVARALVNNPGIVLADEPSGNLDIKTGERLHRLLSDLNRSRATTIIVATHNRDLAASCDRTIKLADGRLSETAES